jgi:hypothetical protein
MKISQYAKLLRAKMLLAASQSKVVYGFECQNDLSTTAEKEKNSALVQMDAK